MGPPASSHAAVEAAARWMSSDEREKSCRGDIERTERRHKPDDDPRVLLAEVTREALTEDDGQRL